MCNCLSIFHLLAIPISLYMYIETYLIRTLKGLTNYILNEEVLSHLCIYNTKEVLLFYNTISIITVCIGISSFTIKLKYQMYTKGGAKSTLYI